MDIVEDKFVSFMKICGENARISLKLKNEGHYVIADFIAPTPEARNLFPADYRVWVDTIKEGRFEDTNKLFEKPENIDFRVTEWNDKNHINIAADIKKNV